VDGAAAGVIPDPSFPQGEEAVEGIVNRVDSVPLAVVNGEVLAAAGVMPVDGLDSVPVLAGVAVRGYVGMLLADD
jgi:hypothetical protein